MPSKDRETKAVAMKYRVTVVLERDNRHAPFDTKERFEQLLVPEHYPETIQQFRKIVSPLRVVDIDCYSEPTREECEEA